jgi:hypothetical protein
MATTTIRVDTETHSRLVSLSERAGASLIDTVRAATEALERRRFGEQVADQIGRLRQDPAAWVDYLTEAGESAVADGID